MSEGVRNPSHIPAGRERFMPKRTIVAIVGRDSQNAQQDSVFCYADEVLLLDDEQVVASPTITLEQLADFLDMEAEAGGSSSFGLHRLLAVMLYRKLGRVQTTDLMQEIAEYGGLDGGNGTDGKGDAF